ncbi:GNAT family N-acetyltransferase [Marinilongibacter aquaticus]|uniref:GNAT family N-acetyltransferase n=1 Tax=Marinilongibacter aquaticus TaxID=2975157 RepID=UPI0021BD1CF1|nr:GNAT family N-acetyltransferase [Marinilongibacter aquaticus]UBM60605.1 GNAT family N-acetyltransferase [Marinilongibacter aquaticus]
MNVLTKTFYKDFVIQVATEEHERYAETIVEEMASSAKARGTGIAKRSPEYIIKKMQEGKAVIATTKTGDWVGFCYIETWEHGKFVANSGLIVQPEYRKSGVATAIKAKAFRLSRQKYPEANIVGLTTSMAVMKINSELGYEPVPFSELPKDDEFWKGCSSCVNYDILTRTNRAHCLCTGMKYEAKNGKKMSTWEFMKESSLYEKWLQMKQKILIRKDTEKVKS